MNRPTHEGQCLLCNRVYSKAGMSRHLRSCAQRLSRKGSGRALHISVDCPELPEYWMHLEVDARSKLSLLDGFLRLVWLECCGHLSAFRIGSQVYALMPMREYGDRSLNIPLGRVLRTGVQFSYEYDFGTTTELRLKVIEETRSAPAEEIRLLARNLPPRRECECGSPATLVCAQCIWEDEGWLCDGCAERHECGEEMFLPVVNSPRTGMCGYEGPL
ncbi:MAG: hypothetical protein ACE5QF_04525 [Thermoplasmata archaeon]